MSVPFKKGRCLFLGFDLGVLQASIQVLLMDPKMIQPGSCQEIVVNLLMIIKGTLLVSGSGTHEIMMNLTVIINRTFLATNLSSCEDLTASLSVVVNDVHISDITVSLLLGIPPWKGLEFWKSPGHPKKSHEPIHTSEWADIAEYYPCEHSTDNAISNNEIDLPKSLGTLNESCNDASDKIIIKVQVIKYVQIRVDGALKQDNDHGILQLSKQEMIYPYRDLDPAPF
ncbi:hypothetical protein VULLAG_LOCUS17501 [Vulpes lagopus]